MLAHQLLGHQPIVLLINLNGRIFRHFKQTNMPRNAQSRSSNGGNGTHIKGTVLHPLTIKVLPPGTLSVIVVFRLTVGRPKKTLETHTGKQTVEAAFGKVLQCPGEIRSEERRVGKE